MRLWAVIASLWLCFGHEAGAQESCQARLNGVLRLDDVVRIMREEGLNLGRDLARDMLPDAGAAVFERQVARLYDLDRMTGMISADLGAMIPDGTCLVLTEFFETPLGGRIVDGEIVARAAFLDRATEDAARQRVADLDPDTDPRLSAISRYILVNDLVEYNVAGSLNSNYMFYRGLVQGGMLQMSDQDIVAETWAQEAEARADTLEWLLAYLDTAYSDLSLKELRLYTEFSAAPDGQNLNRALFASFDRMYEALSFGLGLALADVSRAQDL